MKKTMFKSAFKVGVVAVFLCLIGSNPTFAANPSLRCGLQMYQFKMDGKKFPLIGDSNQNLIFEMKNDGSGGLRGESQARFVNDQSEDDSNSLHGVKAIAIYSEGNGLMVFMKVLQYKNNSDQSSHVDVAAVGASTSYELSMEEGAKKLEFTYINPKVYDPNTDFNSLKGKVSDYELYTVAFQGCRLVD